MKKNTRTLAIATAAIATVGLLTACSTGTDTPAAPTTVTATPAPAAPEDRVAAPTSADEASFVANYESEFGQIDSSTESALIDLGYTVCESLDAGLSFDSILEASNGTGMDAYEAGYIVGAAVYDLCPVYVDDMDQFLAEYDATSNVGA